VQTGEPLFHSIRNLVGRGIGIGVAAPDHVLAQLGTHDLHLVLGQSGLLGVEEGAAAAHYQPGGGHGHYLRGAQGGPGSGHPAGPRPAAGVLPAPGRGGRRARHGHPYAPRHGRDGAGGEITIRARFCCF